MLKVDYTDEMVFSFEGPNLCLLGNEMDFKTLAEVILPLTSKDETNIIVNSLSFVETTNNQNSVIFENIIGGEKYGHIINNGEKVLFSLDPRIWERIFIYFVLMSWKKSTYYLNSFENGLRDLPLDQECHFICSSEF